MILQVHYLMHMLVLSPPAHTRKLTLMAATTIARHLRVVVRTNIFKQYCSSRRLDGQQIVEQWIAFSTRQRFTAAPQPQLNP